jgi:2-polyprenyl-6-hydroxyphenyl methylase/3-demethylubiquinone-9 3-methyltransferase
MEASVSLDNDVYDRLGDSWWDEDNPLSLLHGSMTAGRLEYFRGVLDRLGRLPAGDERPTAIDIGSGGGFLAEEFARLGFAVTGVEPSEVSVRTARAHALAAGLPIDYRAGVGERLPVPNAAFDVAYCCDVLEHVDDVDRVLAETSRVLRPGGVYLFDTPNRTLASRLATAMTQEWRLTRVIDFAAHDWQRFLTPAELGDRLQLHGMVVQETVGLGPRAGWATLGASLMRLRLGRLTYRQVSERFDMGQTPSRSLFAMGFALNSASTAASSPTGDGDHEPLRQAHGPSWLRSR